MSEPSVITVVTNLIFQSSISVDSVDLLSQTPFLCISGCFLLSFNSYTCLRVLYMQKFTYLEDKLSSFWLKLLGSE